MYCLPSLHLAEDPNYCADTGSNHSNMVTQVDAYRASMNTLIETVRCFVSNRFTLHFRNFLLPNLRSYRLAAFTGNSWIKVERVLIQGSTRLRTPQRARWVVFSLLLNDWSVKAT